MPIDLALLLIVALVLVLLCRGPKTLTKRGSAAGKGIKSMRDAASECASEPAMVIASETGPRSGRPAERVPGLRSGF